MSSSSGSVAIPRAVRLGFGAVQAVSKPLAARLAEKWFFTPPRSRVSGVVEAIVRSGRRFTVPVDGRTVVGWEWGAGPVTYLVHGWGSSGGRMGAFVWPLVQAGHRVVTFDAPGHGESGSGLSSAPEFARALLAVAERHGPARAVIAHSLGGSAAVMAAARGLEAERFALLAPAANPGSFADSFATAIGARPDVMALARARSERRLHFSWDDLDVCALVPRLSVPALLVHDRSDEVVHFSNGAAIAASWPGARLLTTVGLGHRGVTRDAGVVAEVLSFVTHRPLTPARSGTSVSVRENALLSASGVR